MNTHGDRLAALYRLLSAGTTTPTEFDEMQRGVRLDTFREWQAAAMRAGLGDA